jgi:hypothetical protein
VGVRRIVPPAVLAAFLAAFVLSGLHSGEGGRQGTSVPVGEPVSRVVYYVDATVGGKPSERKCLRSEGGSSRVTTTPCP